VWRLPGDAYRGPAVGLAQYSAFRRAERLDGALRGRHVRPSVGTLEYRAQADDQKNSLEGGMALSFCSPSRLVLLLLMVGFAVCAHAQVPVDVVRIGVLNDQSGAYADLGGPGAVVAARMAV
jgi:hypothetical protein